MCAITEISASYAERFGLKPQDSRGGDEDGLGNLRARSPEDNTSDVSSPDLTTLRWATPRLIPVRTLQRGNEPKL